MTVNELIQKLEQLPRFAEVFIDCATPHSNAFMICNIEDAQLCDPIPEAGLEEDFVVLGSFTEVEQGRNENN